VFLSGKFFGKFLVLGNLTCAQKSRWLRVAWWTRTFYISSSNWIIPNVAHAQSVDYLRVGRSMFCHAILITRGSSESMVASTTQHEVIELRLHTAWATCDLTRWRSRNSRPTVLISNANKFAFWLTSWPNWKIFTSQSRDSYAEGPEPLPFVRKKPPVISGWQNHRTVSSRWNVFGKR